MTKRTDLAVDIFEDNKENIQDIENNKENFDDVSLTEIKIKTLKSEIKYQKPIGSYITVEFPSVNQITDFTNLNNAIKKAMKMILPTNNNILVAGLGNTDITPDSIGPFTAQKIIATRHIDDQFAVSIGLKGIHSVAVVTPNVLGNTGIESVDFIKAIVNEIKPSSIIVIDALASSSIKRLYKTIQFSNTGISPGSGVKNKRAEISQKVLGIPVISIGIPTVVDADTIAYELTGKEPKEKSDMIVSSKDSDLLCKRLSEILGDALNIFLQPEIDEDIILSL